MYILSVDTSSKVGGLCLGKSFTQAPHTVEAPHSSDNLLKSQEESKSQCPKKIPIQDSSTLFSKSTMTSQELITLQNPELISNKDFSHNHNSMILWESHWDSNNTHSEILTLKFQKLLSQFPLNKNNLEFILLAEGPGSFTGLRVAFNFAKTLSYCMKTPIILTSSFRSYIPIKALDTPVVVILNAYRNKVFASLYRKNSLNLSVEYTYPKALDPKHLESHLETLNDFYVVGDGLDFYKNFWSSSFLKKAKILKPSVLNPAAHQFRLMISPDYCLEFKKSNAFEALPLYIKLSAAEENLR